MISIQTGLVYILMLDITNLNCMFPLRVNLRLKVAFVQHLLFNFTFQMYNIVDSLAKQTGSYGRGK